jgi:S-adenosylmethionine hydrolase
VSAAPGFATISFLSDFGLDDVFVGVCHGVLARLAPAARVIDLTHAVEPGDVRQGAALLARAVPHLPVAVHLAVVDPGVGTARRGVVVSTGRGDALVGPDNGLLPPAGDALGGVTGAWELAGGDRPPASATFHGRDVFAPAAAAVAGGAAPASLGPRIAGLDRLRPAHLRVDAGGRRVDAEVVLIDRFGNLQLAAAPAHVPVLGVRPGDAVEVSVDGRRWEAAYVRTFGDLAPGGLGLYEDSDGQLALAVNAGSAAELVGAARGAVVTIRAGRSGGGRLQVGDSGGPR